MRGRNGPPSPDAVISTLAAGQHGVVARRQLLAAGISHDSVDRRIGTILHPVHAGVYAAGHPELTTDGRWLAAVLACGPGAVLSHRSAAALWELRPAWRDRVEVSAARTVVGRPGIVVHRPRRLEDADRTVVRDIPVTTVSRTLVDVADVAGPRVLRKVLEQAEVLRLDATPVPIRGRRGYRRLVTALEELGPAVALTRSELEDAFLDLCEDAGLPAPLANFSIEGMEVDFCWPGRRLVVEADSWTYHGTRSAYARDRRKTAALQLAGWTVVRFTYEDIVNDPKYVIRTLRRLGVGDIYPPEAR